VGVLEVLQSRLAAEGAQQMRAAITKILSRAAGRVATSARRQPQSKRMKCACGLLTGVMYVSPLQSPWGVKQRGDTKPSAPAFSPRLHLAEADEAAPRMRSGELEGCVIRCGNGCAWTPITATEPITEEQSRKAEYESGLRIWQGDVLDPMPVATCGRGSLLARRARMGKGPGWILPRAWHLGGLQATVGEASADQPFHHGVLLCVSRMGNTRSGWYPGDITSSIVSTLRRHTRLCAPIGHCA
jgi:hypothetical protein